MRRVVYVSGAPGAGKSTLAKPLAQALNLPLLSKDIIKEQLGDSLPDQGDDPLTWSRRLGGASMELIWTLAARAPAVLLEANFRPRSSYERDRLLGLGGRLVEVHCSCPHPEAARRYAARGRSSDHHAVHVVRDLMPEVLAEFDGPMGLGDLVLVDTTTPVDVELVASAVRGIFDAI